MLKVDSFENRVTRSDSYILDIDESFVRSDIADIIGKMYTPKAHSGGAGDTGCDVQEGGRGREGVWTLDDSPKKRFGFYFESVTTRNNIESSRDTSTSDVVSLPSARSRQKRRHGFVCKCCKRQILHRISEKRMKSACNNCQRKYKANEHQENFNREYLDVEEKSYSKHETFGVEEYDPQVSKERQQSVCQFESFESFNKHQQRQQLQDYQPLFDAKIQSSVSAQNYRSDAKIHRDQREQNLPKCSPVICNCSCRRCKEKYPTVEESVCYVADQLHVDRFKSLQVVPELPECSGTNLAIQERFTCVSSSKQRNKKVLRRLFGSVSTWARFNKKTKHSTKIIRNEMYDKNPSEPQIKRVKTEPTQVTKIQDKSSENQLETIYQGNAIDYSQTECFLSFKEVPSTNTEHKQDLQSQARTHSHVADKNLQYEYQPEEWAMQFWGKVFSFCNVASSFLTAFILQLLKFLLQSVTQPLIWGSLQIGSEHCFQPCLETLFRSILKPIFMLIQNVAGSIRDICHPIAQCFGYFLQEFALILRACRLFEIHHIYKKVDDNQIQNV